MERRNFLKGALAIFGAAAVGVTMTAGNAEAAPLDTVKDIPAAPEVEQVAANEGDTLDANGQYYYRRRRFYRPRRVYYRRRVYRPRRVYYYRPRRVYYRPRYRRIFW